MDVTVRTADNQYLEATFVHPEGSKRIVIFAHGSGSNRNSPRNTYVARILNEAGFSTLLLDLLSKSEAQEDEKTREYRFNIPLLTNRLIAATQTVIGWPESHDISIGYYGASTGAAAALAGAAAQDRVKAVVSRGGRPDLADSSLGRVRVPTLLLVGGNDSQTISFNGKALDRLKNVQDKRMVIVPGASHTFEEPGTIEEVAKHSASWFERYLR